MKILVCGSRAWADAPKIRERLAQIPLGTVVISGGADGADRMAENIAREFGLHVACVRPLYGSLPKKLAPLKRNEAMLRLDPELVIAFQLGQSRGTQYTIEKAKELGIPVEIID